MKNPVLSVVDDDESVRASISSLIRSLGFTARAFASAEEFLSSGDIEATDCLIADIQMPGMSGVELQQELIARGPTPPIVFITAFPQERIRQQVLSAGALSFLSKPCDGGVLVEQIEKALESRA